MKHLLLTIILGLLFTACNPPAKDKNASEDQGINKTEISKDGVLIHITESYAEPHRVLMPLKMAIMMAQDKDVIVYMDIHAVELLVKNAKDLSYGDFETCQTYLKQLIDMKVPVYACPTCLKLAGFVPEDLMPGIQTANKEAFFNFTKGRIITLDY